MRIGMFEASLSCMVMASCASLGNDHDVAGRVHGLWDGGGGVVLRLQSGGLDELRTISVDGAFRFEAGLAAGVPYTVSVAQSPAQHDCVIERGGSGVVADPGPPSVSVACRGPAAAIALSGAWGWSFDPTEEVQTFTGPLAAQAVELTVSGTATMRASIDGATVPLGEQYASIASATSAASASIALPLGSRTVPVSFRTSDGLSKTYQLMFVRVASVIAQVAYVKASNTDRLDTFGESVSLSGDTLAVGAPAEDSAATGVNGNQADNSVFNSGAVYVFVRSGATWSQQAYIKASSTSSVASFGGAVSVSGNTLAVGAIGVNPSGVVYVFVRNGTTWSQQAMLQASNPTIANQFGNTVALSGDTLAVGSPFESSRATGINGNQNNNLANSSGAVYVFQRTGQTWAQQAYVKASNAEAFDHFGTSLGLSGNTMAVGATGESSGATGVNGNQNDNSADASGAVYVFQRTGQTWAQQAYLKPPTRGPQQIFGKSLSLSDNTLATGADGAGLAGDLHVFFRSGTTWTAQAVLVASNRQEGDLFGMSVAISGDTLVAGAPAESSIARGVDGDQNDNTARGAGAAYLFVRTGGSWQQQAYLKASNTDPPFPDIDGRFRLNDRFGNAVAVSGGTVVVGARNEFGGSAGINGNQEDNSKRDSGAAYIFGP